MISKKIVIVTPGGATTGGVELLHQLSDLLNQNGFNSVITYYPFHKSFKIPDPYQKYDIKSSSIKDCVDDSCIYILPETYSYLINKFGKSNCLVWWMSVDNYINSSSILYAFKNFFLPWNYISIKNKPSILNGLIANLYQSNYAKQFLIKNGIINNLFPLSDYINEDYAQYSSQVDIVKKEKIILYNPAKGYEITKLLINKLNSKFTFVPIKNLSRVDVIGLMTKSMIYIDFGNHPGKDRIPREAAALGCIVITNKQGSAGNDFDIPIPHQYKFDISDASFINRLEFLFEDIFNYYTKHYEIFASYRDSISRENLKFKEDALNIFKKIISIT